MTGAGRRLDIFLNRTITELKAKDEDMSKFTEIAERMKAMRTSLDARADDLSQKMDKTETRGDEIFRRHEAVLEEAEAGFKEMEEALHEMEGANSSKANGEDKTKGLNSFQPDDGKAPDAP